MHGGLNSRHNEQPCLLLIRKHLQFALLFIAITLQGGCGSSAQEGIPFLSLTRQNPVYDLGRIEWDISNTTKLSPQIFNELDETVKYQSKTSCGCISIKKDIIIEPKASTSVPVELVLPDEPGPFSRSIYFKCVSGNSPDLSLSLKGDVAPTQQLRAHLDVIDFGRFEKPVQRMLRLNRFDGSAVNFSEISCPLNFQIVDTQVTNSSGKESVTITIEANPEEIPEGRFNSTITVFTNHKKFKHKTVDIRGFNKYTSPQTTED